MSAKNAARSGGKVGAPIGALHVGEAIDEQRHDLGGVAVDAEGTQTVAIELVGIGVDLDQVESRWCPIAAAGTRCVFRCPARDRRRATCGERGPWVRTTDRSSSSTP